MGAGASTHGLICPMRSISPRGWDGNVEGCGSEGCFLWETRTLVVRKIGRWWPVTEAGWSSLRRSWTFGRQARLRALILPANIQACSAGFLGQSPSQLVIRKGRTKVGPALLSFRTKVGTATLRDGDQGWFWMGDNNTSRPEQRWVSPVTELG